jgi:Ca-activated chloride channel family protein
MNVWLRHGAIRAAAHPYRVVLGAMLLTLAALSLCVGWVDAWIGPDQRGAWLMSRGRYAEAADAFVNPLWRGIALMKAGSFKEAAAQFAGLDSAEAAYDEGNALVMLGKYEDAVTSYDRALALRPGWPDAKANRTLASLRAERMKLKGGDETGGQIKPDEVVFEKGHPGTDQGEKEPGAGGGAMSDEAIRSLWLKQVHTQPGDFLRAKFMYQLRTPAVQAAPTPPPPSPARP